MNPDEILNKHMDLFKDSYIEKLEKQVQLLKDRINKIEKHLFLIKEIKHSIKYE